MTRTGILLLALLPTYFAGEAAAQPARSVEIFGGYSLLPANGDDFPRGTSRGVQASVTANLNRWFGIVGDFGAQFDTNSDLGLGFEGQTAETRVIELLAGLVL